MPSNICKCMVDCIVSFSPKIGTRTKQVQRHGRKAVDPLTTGVRRMPPVVLNAESDAGQGDSQRNRQWQGLPPVSRPKHQQHVGSHRPSKNGRAFQVHLNTISSSPTGANKQLVNTLAKHLQKCVVRSEFKTSSLLINASRRNVISPVRACRVRLGYHQAVVVGTLHGLETYLVAKGATNCELDMELCEQGYLELHLIKM